MATSVKRCRLTDAYAFPGFRQLQRVQGMFGDPKARIITLVRRGKRRSEAAAARYTVAGTTEGSYEFEIRPALTTSVSCSAWSSLAGYFKSTCTRTWSMCCSGSPRTRRAGSMNSSRDNGNPCSPPTTCTRRNTPSTPRSQRPRGAGHAGARKANRWPLGKLRGAKRAVQDSSSLLTE